MRDSFSKLRGAPLRALVKPDEASAIDMLVSDDKKRDKYLRELCRGLTLVEVTTKINQDRAEAESWRVFHQVRKAAPEHRLTEHIWLRDKM